ncbi:hypothetical protein [Pseudoalteromonas tunicata]|jgi:hypothetical protein|uniref:Putative orphan protein n=1 Tax=Pseudoalteromonas tunicata D2 TaxID=87626 RepID=A4C9J4_9GAMM|nr:hypothetical protein [Pseudoalteromonas tunicata]ATC94600.1 hypothetical protein PTUN_a2065 [Pseudoalteromonas tunicata]AXT30324.1 hypothetical protein D1819_05490 [Pseudoalteromonas tunicata]EAR28052.1 putative orphan protein [Pseudoalteromonas tunicata D2]MDP4984465.1 hypothetical protein [Pseudoalteromonas tunicata]MDP5212101.1 hypothetical protein [Pseudoalteromonas tunicata]
MSDSFKVIPPTTTVYCQERGEGWTLTGITSINERTSVMFDGTRYTLDAKEVIEVLLPNALARAQQNQI